MEYLLLTAFEELVEDVVEDHLGLGVGAVEPEDVIFTEGNLECTIFLHNLQFFLDIFLFSLQPVYYHSSFQLSQYILSGEALVQA